LGSDTPRFALNVDCGRRHRPILGPEEGSPGLAHSDDSVPRYARMSEPSC
jgi:hypothetical protein